MSGGRALIPGLASPHPIGAGLPAVYEENEFVHRFTAAFDEVLAPVLCTLDNLAAYFDPGLAPSDFVEYLAGWVGAERLAPNRREAVAGAVGLHALRGTRAGLAAQLRLALGVEPEIEESGGAAWSTEPGGPLPGSAEPRLLVRLRVPDPAAVDRRALAELVRAVVPVHLAVRTEVVGTHGEGGGDGDL
ncbi:phage tail protein [Kitasatospora cinereorecta]|uniref:Phage tail protein n=1 Tax=Kitasatospora cinereorecta TaxID=285560 RepID=A0ABW0VGB7_9ACTN